MLTVLNFLSFESINFLKLLHSFNVCGIQNPACFKTLMTFNCVSGYTASYTYKQIDKLFPAAFFILIEESPTTVLNQLLYGYYKQIFNKKVVSDFKKYFNIDLENLDEKHLAEQMQNYYLNVKENFKDKDNLLVLDLTSYENKFSSFVSSDELPAVIALLENFSIPGLKYSPETFLSLKQAIENKTLTKIKDFLLKSPFEGTPEIVDYLSAGYCGMERQAEPVGYLDFLLEDLKKHEI